MPNDARIRITRVVNEEKLGAQIEEKMRRLGGAIGVRAQRIVPKRTWALHDSIVTETERFGARVVTTVGAGDERVKYAMAVEQGTSRAAAQPYLRPAMLQVTGADLRYQGSGPTPRGAMKIAYSTARARRRNRGA